MKALLKIILALTLGLPGVSMAADFTDQIQNFMKACPGVEDCPQPYHIETLLNEEPDFKNNASDPELVSKLVEVAHDQAQIWGDTILEGDFVAEGQVRLDSVLAVYREGQLMGYHITYSEVAWDTSTCTYDGQKQSLKDCKAGRISEGSFISPDFVDAMTDRNKFAEFQSDK